MTIAEAVKATYEVVGQSTTDLQLAVLIDELSRYPSDQVMTALSRCRKELRKLTLADILDRLPGGHPGPEEAWAMVSKALQDESVSIAWTDEMAEACGVARGLASDPVAARLAFKETYIRLINDARAKATPVRWRVSLGYDTQGREEAHREVARRNGRPLPALSAPSAQPALSIAAKSMPA